MPPTQLQLSRHLGVGNENAYVGRDGWLFYRPGVDYLTGTGFLDPQQLARRAAISESQAGLQPDPRKAILDFHQQLADRGITLIVVPIPVKPGVHPDRLSSRFQESDLTRPLHNASYSRFVEELRDHGVLICDLDDVFAGANNSGPLYLATDTHWRPENNGSGLQGESRSL